MLKQQERQHCYASSTRCCPSSPSRIWSRCRQASPGHLLPVISVLFGCFTLYCLCFGQGHRVVLNPGSTFFSSLAVLQLGLLPPFSFSCLLFRFHFLRPAFDLRCDSGLHLGCRLHLHSLINTLAVKAAASRRLPNVCL